MTSLLLSSLLAGAAWAGGVVSPVDQPGLVEAATDAPVTTWRVAVDFGQIWSNLTFPDRQAPDLAVNAAAATIEYVPFARVSFQLTLGAAINGTLIGAHSLDVIRAGWLGGAGVSYEIVKANGPWPFLLASFNVSTATLPTVNATGVHTLYALDGRLSLLVGKTYFNFFTPYIVIRGFAGPDTWHLDTYVTTGYDPNLYQLGAGVVLHARGFDLHVEGDPLGEKRVSGGVGYSF